MRRNKFEMASHNLEVTYKKKSHADHGQLGDLGNSMYG